jgi:hypothetical protein
MTDLFDFGDNTLEDLMNDKETAESAVIKEIGKTDSCCVWFVTPQDIKSPVPNLLKDVDCSSPNASIEIGKLMEEEVLLLRNVVDARFLDLFKYLGDQVHLIFVEDENMETVDYPNVLAVYFQNKGFLTPPGMVKFVKEFVEKPDNLSDQFAKLAPTESEIESEVDIEPEYSSEISEDEELD